MRRLFAFLSLVVLFGAVLTPATAAENEEPMPVVVGGPAAVAEDTVLEIDALGWEALWLYGANRYETAAEVATAFYGGETSEYVYVATGLNFPDALAGVPAAVVDEAPILLVTRTGIPTATAAALAELKPQTIYVLGGPAAVSEAVVSALGTYASTVERIFGPTRYHTAVEVSKRFFPTTDGVFVATGQNYPDALAAGPSAGYWEAPILLVQKNAIPAVTAAELSRLDPDWIVVLGGPGAVSNAVVAQLDGYASDYVEVIAGADRYETAAMLSEAEWDWGRYPHVTTGMNFPDALTAGAIAGQLFEPVLLTRKNSLPAVTATELTRLMSAAP